MDLNETFHFSLCRVHESKEPRLPTGAKAVILHGYFQNLKYFWHHKQLVRSRMGRLSYCCLLFVLSSN